MSPSSHLSALISVACLLALVPGMAHGQQADTVDASLSALVREAEERSPRVAAAGLLLLAACGGSDATASRAAALDVEPLERVPSGELPPGATYDFGASRGGAADIGGAYFVGRSDAPVTIAVFGDFQCRFCARTEAATAEARRQLLRDGAVRVVYLDFPLPIHSRSEAL